jgi:hypothetical protein
MAARLTATLAWAALKTEAHWEAGQRDLAKQSAQRFVKQVEVRAHTSPSVGWL